jgi:hypothetical protein
MHRAGPQKDIPETIPASKFTKDFVTESGGHEIRSIRSANRRWGKREHTCMGFSRGNFAVRFLASFHFDRLSSSALAFAVLNDDFSTSQDDVLAYWFLVPDSHQEELKQHVTDLKEDFCFPSYRASKSLSRFNERWVTTA